MKRIDAITLYSTIKDLKAPELISEVFEKYINLRIKLKDNSKEYQKYSDELKEQTKPTDWKEGDDVSKWNDKFKPLMEKHLSEDIKLDCKIFTAKDVVSMTEKNNLNGEVMDTIAELMIK